MGDLSRYYSKRYHHSTVDLSMLIAMGWLLRIGDNCSSWRRLSQPCDTHMLVIQDDCHEFITEVDEVTYFHMTLSLVYKATDSC